MIDGPKGKAVMYCQSREMADAMAVEGETEVIHSGTYPRNPWVVRELAPSDKEWHELINADRWAAMRPSYIANLR